MSKTPARRGRPKDPDKRDAILAAATALFLEQGYAASMERIAALAGVSKLTLYSHYRHKDDLFQQCVTAKCQEHTPDAVYDPAGSAPLKQRLQAIATGFIELVMSEEAIRFYRMMCAEARQTGKLGRLFHDAGPERTLQQFEQLLAAAQRNGELRVRNRRLAANHFFSMLQGEHFMRAIMGEPRPTMRVLRAHIDDVVATFLRAYAP